MSLRALDVGLLQAGASMKGEFENRLRQVIDEVQSSPKPIILFIDEAHTLIGAGGAAGTGDAANLLKPALARGTLRTIAATTWAEYKKHIEKDPALTRRFQVVQVDEPSEEKAILMMRGMASTLEKHHRVQMLDEAIEAAVKLSHRYIPARQLPDKSVSLLDTACARVAVSQHAVPAEVRTAAAASRRSRPSWRSSAASRPSAWMPTDARKRLHEKLLAEKKRLGELESAGRRRRSWSTRSWSSRRTLRGAGTTPVESGQQLAGATRPQPAARRRSRRREGGAAPAARRSGRAVDEAEEAAGRADEAAGRDRR